MIVRKRSKVTGGITDAEGEALKRHADLWIKRAMRTDPIDPEKITSAIKALYAAADLDEPRVVIAPSPLVMAFAYGAAAAIWHQRITCTNPCTNPCVNTDAATGDTTLAITSAATRNATYTATDAAADIATRDPTRIATHTNTLLGTATHAATYNATHAAAEAATPNATRDATHTATRAATHDATDSSTGAAIRYATHFATGASTHDTTYDATYTATYNATHAAAEAATHAATYTATRNASYTATRAATRAATEAATHTALYDATYTTNATYTATHVGAYNATHAATHAATYTATLTATEAASHATPRSTHSAEREAALACRRIAGVFGILCAARWTNVYHSGNMWVTYESYITAMRDILGLRLPCHDKYKAWENAAIEGGFRVLHEKFCIVSDFPEVLKTDAQNRPHCEDGPSHRWRDGWALYFWHGTRVPAHWIEQKNSLKASEVLSESNLERRRAGCEMLGWSRILAELKTKTIDNDPDPEIGRLIEVRLPDLRRPAKFLVVRCATGREFVIGIPSHITKALDAQAWCIGLEPKDFNHPEVRT